LFFALHLTALFNFHSVIQQKTITAFYSAAHTEKKTVLFRSKVTWNSLQDKTSVIFEVLHHLTYTEYAALINTVQKALN